MLHAMTPEEAETQRKQKASKSRASTVAGIERRDAEAEQKKVEHHRRMSKESGTCIKPSKVGGRRWSKAEISEAAGLPIEPKRAASLDTEECVKPSDIMHKRGSEDCLDLDLHTRLAHTRAERAERRESQKRSRENAVAAPSAPSAPSAPPKASKAKRQRSEPGPPRTQDDDGWGWCSGARLAEDGDAGSLLRPRPEMSWGEHSLARALP